MKRLSTQIAEEICRKHRRAILEFLAYVDRDLGTEDASSLDTVRASISGARAENENGPDALFDDLYVLDRYLDFFVHYGLVWKHLTDQQFSKSWNTLQDSLDSLRLIRKFSGIDISEFEDQLLELAKSYPYNVFFSIGATVDRFECSICGEDIDSYDCPHRKGRLYRGRMAYGIARNITNLDHVAMVDKPEDRRCVVEYEDTGEQFKLVRFIAELLVSRKMKVSDFGRLIFSKRRIPNPEYRKVGGNHLCYCGSGRKFKVCCILKTHTEGDHVDIVPDPLVIGRAIA